MILLADSEGPDQTVQMDVQSDLGLRYLHMQKDTFLHATANIIIMGNYGI